MEAEGCAVAAAVRAAAVPAAAVRATAVRAEAAVRVMAAVRCRGGRCGWRRRCGGAGALACTSLALRMNDAKIMSQPCSTANARSFLSFSESAGRSTSMLGRLHPLREPSLPELTTSHSMSSPEILFTLSAISPSSTKIWSPSFITLVMFL